MSWEKLPTTAASTEWSLLRVSRKADASAAVVLEVVQGLQFRRADSLVRDIMASAREEVWTLVARSRLSGQACRPGTECTLE